jgi:NitT/TauT family transport system substrate-binding protein
MLVSRSYAMRTLATMALVPAAGTVARAQSAAAVRAVIIPIEPAALIYYAATNGFFTKAGIEVSVTQNPSSPAGAAALAAGSYDVGYGTICNLAVAHVRHLPFVIIAPGVGWAPGKFAGEIMVASSSPVRTAKDLNGKTFGTAGLGTIAEYLPRAWMDKNGGDSSTVRFVELAFPETADALAAGRIDAAYMVEPFATIAAKKNLARLLVTGDDAIGPSYTATGWYCTQEWARAHPDVVARFSAAMLEAARWANANQTAVVPILAKELHTDPALTAQAKRPYFPERLTAAEMQPWIDVTAKYAKFASFPASELIYVPQRG